MLRLLTGLITAAMLALPTTTAIAMPATHPQATIRHSLSETTSTAEPVADGSTTPVEHVEDPVPTDPEPTENPADLEGGTPAGPDGAPPSVVTEEPVAEESAPTDHPEQAPAEPSMDPLAKLSPVPFSLEGASAPVDPNLHDSSGKVPTLDLWSPEGKPKELDKVKADKSYKSQGWSAAFSHPLGGTRNLDRQPNVEIKGRGNNTWCMSDNGRSGKFCNLRLPLQIKFDDKVDLIGEDPTLTKKNDNANKTWILLPNQNDATFMRNKLAFDYAQALGMPGTPEARWVDLRIDGKYMGNYLLTEKVEAKSGRVDLKDPAGVIVELDNNYYYTEPFWFESKSSKSYYVLKDAKSDDKCDPGKMWSDASYECVPGNSQVTAKQCAAKPAEDPAYKEQNAAEPRLDKKTYLPQNENCLPKATADAWAHAQKVINDFDKELTKSVPDWTKISSLIDVDSFARFYFVSDLAENAALVKSSIFFYLDGPADKLHAGPIWDFDTTIFNNATSEAQGSDPTSDYAKNAYVLRKKVPAKDEWGYYRPESSWYYDLYRNPEFVQTTNEMWLGEGAYVGQTPVRDVTDRTVGNINSYWDQLVGTNSTALGSALDTHAKFKVLGTTFAHLGRPYATTFGGEAKHLCTNVNERVQFLKRDYGDIPLLRVKTQVKGASTPWVNNGQLAGTVLENKHIETFSWDLNGSNGVPGWSGPEGITASAKLANGTSIKVTDSKKAKLGTAGVKMTQFKMSLNGQLAATYDVQYRAKLSSGWQSWRSSGEWAGSTSGHKLEGVQVRLLLKSAAVTSAPQDCYDFKAEEAAIRAVSSPDQGFKDVTGDNKYFKEINWLGATGIATGTPINDANGNRMRENFKPSESVTREVMAQWLYRYANPQGYVAPTVSPFSDVKTTDSSYTAIAWLYETGFTGDSGGKYRPKEKVTRQKFAVVLLRYAKSTGVAPEDFQPSGPSPFKDVATTHSHYAPIYWLDAHGIMTASGGNFRPGANIERAEMAAAFYHYAENFG